MSPLFQRLAVILANSSAFAALYTVFATVELGRPSSPGTAVWLFMSAACCVFLEFYLKKERELRSVITVCVSFYALQAAAVFLIYGAFAPFTGMVIAMLMWVYSYYKCFEYSRSPVTTENIIAAFDGSVFALIFSVFYCSVSKISLAPVYPLVFCLLLALFALVHKRSGGKGRQGRSTVYIAAAVLLFASLALAFVLWASDITEKLLKWLFFRFVDFAEWLAATVNAFIFWFVSLFPQRQYEGEIDMDPAASLSGMGEMDMEIISPDFLLWFLLGAVALIIIGGVVYAFIHSGKLRSLGSAGSSKGLKRQRKGLFGLFKDWLLARFSKLRFLVLSLIKRNTPAGLLLYTERRFGKRQAQETCREYLNRLSGENPHLAAAFGDLAEGLDAEYFAPAPLLSPARISQLRKELKKNP